MMSPLYSLQKRMSSRYQSNGGRASLKEALLAQELFEKDDALVEEIVDRIEIIKLTLDDVLIGDGRGERDLFLILSGKVAILEGGEEVAVRSKGGYVGEMTLIDPDAKRSATVVARDTTVVGRLDEPSFTALANKYPALWRNLAITMVQRLNGTAEG